MMLGSSPAERVHESIGELLPQIAARAAEVERLGRIPVDLFDALVATGCFGGHLPTSYGGLGLPLKDVNSIVEHVSRADGAVGWVTMVAIAGPLVGALFEKDVFEELFAAGANPRIRAAIAPKGVAVPADGGYLVSGQWPFMSGGPDPTHVAGHCVVIDGGVPRMTSMGIPETVVAMMHADAGEFIDTWHVVGMRGTDSCDFAVHDVFVPLRSTTNVFTAEPCVDIPLARLPVRVVLAPGHGAVAIGIAQGALDDISALAASKRSAMNPMLRLAADPVFQHTLGEQAMRLRAARALLDQQTDVISTAAGSGRQLTPEEIVAARAMAAHVTSICVGVVDSAYTLAGSASLSDHSALQRRLRDIHVATQHLAATSEGYRTLGALLAGEAVPPLALV